MYTLKCLLFALVLLAFPHSSFSQLAEKVYDNVVQATVSVICDDGASSGVGTIIGITPQGRALILTAVHVIASNYSESDTSTPLEFYERIEVKLASSLSAERAKVVTLFIDRENDLALIGTRTPAPVTQVISYTSSTDMQTRDDATAFGLGEADEISSLDGKIITQIGNYLVLSRKFTRTYSGGPMVDNKGRMVGLATSLKKGVVENEGYALAMDTLAPIVNSWLARMSLRQSWKAEGGGLPMPWIIGGAVVAGGGTAAAIALSGGDSGSRGFPQPPGRPGN